MAFTRIPKQAHSTAISFVIIAIPPLLTLYGNEPRPIAEVPAIELVARREAVEEAAVETERLASGEEVARYVHAPCLVPVGQRELVWCAEGRCVREVDEDVDLSERAVDSLERLRDGGFVGRIRLEEEAATPRLLDANC